MQTVPRPTSGPRFHTPTPFRTKPRLRAPPHGTPSLKSSSGRSKTASHDLPSIYQTVQGDQVPRVFARAILMCLSVWRRPCGRSRPLCASCCMREKLRRKCLTTGAAREGPCSLRTGIMPAGRLDFCGDDAPGVTHKAPSQEANPPPTPQEPRKTPSDFRGHDKGPTPAAGDRIQGRIKKSQLGCGRTRVCQWYCAFSETRAADERIA